MSHGLPLHGELLHGELLHGFLTVVEFALLRPFTRSDGM